jgi:hypothetical protein
MRQAGGDAKATASRPRLDLPFTRRGEDPRFSLQEEGEEGGNDDILFIQSLDVQGLICSLPCWAPINQPKRQAI